MLAVQPILLAILPSAKSITLVLTIALILLLMVKESISGVSTPTAKETNRKINLVILPLVVLFVLVVVFQVLHVIP